MTSEGASSAVLKSMRFTSGEKSDLAFREINAWILGPSQKTENKAR